VLQPFRLRFGESTIEVTEIQRKCSSPIAGGVAVITICEVPKRRVEIFFALGVFGVRWRGEERGLDKGKRA